MGIQQRRKALPKNPQKALSDFAPHLLQSASAYIDCCEYRKAKTILNFLNGAKGLDEALENKRLILETMVLFKLSEYKRCVNNALKLYKSTEDVELQAYLLLTINRCFIALNGPKEAKKYLTAYLMKKEKHEK